jgi:hypothetical protein
MNPEKNVMDPLPDNITKELILSRAFFDREDLTALVQIAANLLNNPIMIIDTTFQCLANFPNSPLASLPGMTSLHAGIWKMIWFSIWANIFQNFLKNNAMDHIF